MLLKDKTAIITGANRGIGLATLELFAQNGANVFACARLENEEFLDVCKKLSDSYNVNVNPIFFDLENEEEIKQGAKEILSHKVPIDILVNNAGVILESSLFPMTKIETMRRTFDINFFAQTILTQYIVRNMSKNKSGSIINVASITALDGFSTHYEYAGSKGAILGATKELACEFAKYNIRVNAVAPGITNTNIAKSVSDELQQLHADRTLMKRLAEPLEIANSILFLASDMSSYMTGQVLRVDGGVL